VEIKNAEGQTLLTLLRVAICGLAALSVFGMQNLANVFFDTVQNSGNLISSITYDADNTPLQYGRPYVLYYDKTLEDNKSVSHIYKQYYITGEEGALGLVDSAGNVLLSQSYQDIIVLPATYILKTDGLWRFYDQTEITPLDENNWENVEISLDESGKINSDLVKVEKDGLYGATDQQGHIVVQPQWDDFEPYTYAVDWPIIRVKKNGLYGFINNSGQILIDVKYDYARLDLYSFPNVDDSTTINTVPVVFVLKDNDWGGIFRGDNGKPTGVNWDIEPSAEALADHESSAI
jgi:hypothetical protein